MASASGGYPAFSDAMRDLPPDTMQNVDLADIWVLAVESDAQCVCFVLDAVLQEGHPLFYWPPKPGEQHAYARLRWCLRGHVHWSDGPHLRSPATDASGEQDFGNIDAWIQEGPNEPLAGVWGMVVVRAYAITDSLEETREGGDTFRLEARRVINYGLALMLSGVSDWLDDQIPNRPGTTYAR